MDMLVNKIRTRLNMSQTEFAARLHVAPSTVNHWENSQCSPDASMQTKIYNLCKEKSVPVYNLTLEKIAHASAHMNPGENRTLLYHGSKSGIEGAIRPMSRKQCDFGKGFYMGTDPRQALTLICDYDQSKFYIVSIDMEKLTQLNVPVGIDWAMLVAYNRGRMEKISGTPLYHKYHAMSSGKDLIIGNIANDRIFYVIDSFFIGNVTDAALIHSLSALQLGRQYVAVSQKACDAVRIELEIPLSGLERTFIKEAAEENRARGISLANEICKSHRREGRYFDEILDAAKNGGDV